MAEKSKKIVKKRGKTSKTVVDIEDSGSGLKKIVGIIVVIVMILVVAFGVWYFVGKSGVMQSGSVTTFATKLTLELPEVGNVEGKEGARGVSSALQILFVLSIISLAPFFLLMFTSFTRIIIALHFVRSAIGTQQMPPNQILIGIALFLTMFLMAPTFTEINARAIEPLSRGEISSSVAIEEGLVPLRTFMLRQVDKKDVAMFAGLAGEEVFNISEVSNRVLLPSFMVGEITRGFQFGVMIFMPFIVIDMVVASTLMAMGMMMLPPAMISLPFKILLFISVGGWGIVIENLVRTFG